MTAPRHSETNPHHPGDGSPTKPSPKLSPTFEPPLQSTQTKELTAPKIIHTTPPLSASPASPALRIPGRPPGGAWRPKNPPHAPPDFHLPAQPPATKALTTRNKMHATPPILPSHAPPSPPSLAPP